MLLPISAFGQALEPLEDFHTSFGRYQLNQYLKKPSTNGVSGISFLPFTTEPTSLLGCDEKLSVKKTHYEILLIADGSTAAGIKGINRQENTALTVKEYFQERSASALNGDAVLSDVKDAYKKYMEQFPGYDSNGNPFVPEVNLQSDLGRSLITESLLHASAASPLSEKEIAASWAQTIGHITNDKKERLALLATIGDKLYANYNDSRNPKANNAQTNPDNKPIPTGDLTLQQIFGAALEGNVYSGGVCNDISETLAYVGEALFPGDDVLTITGGSHFGVIVTDGNETTLIDGSTTRQFKDGFKLHENSSSANMRISKVIDGQLKEIAVVETELGQLVEETFQSDKPLLKTSNDISKVITQIKKIIELNENKRRELSLTTGAAKLSDSEVVMVVAKYETFSRNGKFTIGTGSSSQRFDASGKTYFNIHFKTEYDRTLFSYKSESVNLNFVSGIQASGSFTPSQKNYSGISGSLDLSNRMNVDYKSKKNNGIRAHTDVGVYHSFGPTSWGETTGAVSTKVKLEQVLKNTTFHLNQVYANALITKPVNENITAGVNLNYQGSNIGQSVRILGNVEVTAPNGVEILIFGGVEKNDIRGFQTKNGLLAGPNGGTMGVNLHKNNIKVNTTIRGIGTTTPTVNAGVNILFKTKAKKKPKSL